MQVLLAGTPAIVVPLFERIRASEIKILGVITNPPRPRGRSGTPEPSPVAQWASDNAMVIFEDSNLDAAIPLLQKANLVFVVAYGQLIPEKYLTMPTNGWVNLHFSTLPEARGAAPVQRLIASGAKEIGFSLFKLEEGMDTGPIYLQNPPTDITGFTTGDVWEKLINQAIEIIVPELLAIGEGKAARNQSVVANGKNLSIAPKISTAEARIDWQVDAAQNYQRILAFNPTPSSWTLFRGERMLIHRAKLSNHGLPNPSETLLPGEIYIAGGAFYVGCANSLLEILELQPAGKKRMNAQDWLRGSNIQLGERFE